MSESDRASEFIRPVPLGDMLAALTRDRSDDQRPRLLFEAAIGLATSGLLALWTAGKRRERMRRHEWLTLATFARTFPLDEGLTSRAIKAAEPRRRQAALRLACILLATAAIAFVATHGATGIASTLFARSPAAIALQLALAGGFIALSMARQSDRVGLHDWSREVISAMLATNRRDVAMPRSRPTAGVIVFAIFAAGVGPLWLAAWWLARDGERRLLRDVWRLRLQLAERLLESREAAKVEFDIVEPAKA